MTADESLLGSIPRFWLWWPISFVMISASLIITFDALLEGASVTKFFLAATAFVLGVIALKNSVHMGVRRV